MTKQITFKNFCQLLITLDCSTEVYLALSRERKVQILCKSQQKVYNTFADELSDYIQIQKARGIAQKPPVLLVGSTQTDEREGSTFPEWEPNLQPSYNPPHPSCYGPGRDCHPWYPGRSWSPQGDSPAVVAPSTSPLLPGHLLMKKRLRKPPSCPPHEALLSSNFSSYSSSSCSSTSESGDSKSHHRGKKELRNSKRERDKRAREDDSDQEEKNRKRRRTESHQVLDEGRRGESRGSEEEERRKKGGKSRDMNKSQEKKVRVDPEAAAGESHHNQGDLNVEQRDSEQDEPSKAKNKREKKKGKDDTRTEEEKLWDDCILGF